MFSSVGNGDVQRDRNTNKITSCVYQKLTGQVTHTLCPIIINVFIHLSEDDEISEYFVSAVFDKKLKHNVKEYITVSASYPIIVSIFFAGSV